MDAYSNKELIVKVILLKGEKGETGTAIDTEARSNIASEAETRAREDARLETLIEHPTIADGSITTPKMGDGAVTAPKLAENAVRLRFTNVSVPVASFVSDNTYEEYPYRAAIALTGATAAMRPDVVFGLADAISGNFAPIADSYSGGVYIYAVEVPESAITIPVIDLWR